MILIKWNVKMYSNHRQKLSQMKNKSCSDHTETGHFPAAQCLFHLAPPQPAHRHAGRGSPSIVLVLTSSKEAMVDLNVAKNFPWTCQTATRSKASHSSIRAVSSFFGPKVWGERWVTEWRWTDFRSALWLKHQHASDESTVSETPLYKG